MFDSASYQSQLSTKMAKLQDFVESKLASAASNQKSSYDKKCKQRSFKVNDPVWLSIPTAGKLDSKWEGNWKVHAMKGPVNVEITNGNRTKVVHVNRVQPRILSFRQKHVWTQPKTTNCRGTLLRSNTSLTMNLRINQFVEIHSVIVDPPVIIDSTL